MDWLLIISRSQLERVLTTYIRRCIRHRLIVRLTGAHRTSKSARGRALR
jgi:hypothetical protein